jgi:hypothetical protein
MARPISALKPGEESRPEDLVPPLASRAAFSYFGFGGNSGRPHICYHLTRRSVGRLLPPGAGSGISRLGESNPDSTLLAATLKRSADKSSANR